MHNEWHTLRWYDKATARWSIFTVRGTHFIVHYLLPLVKCNVKEEMKLPIKSNNQHSLPLRRSLKEDVKDVLQRIMAQQISAPQ